MVNREKKKNALFCPVPPRQPKTPNPRKNTGDGDPKKKVPCKKPIEIFVMPTPKFSKKGCDAHTHMPPTQFFFYKVFTVYCATFNDTKQTPHQGDE